MKNNIDIKLKDVYKEYSSCNTDLKRLLAVLFPSRKNKRKVLENINIEIARGERVAFIGKNGSGKSTILKIISQITIPDSGDVIVNRKVYPLLEVNAGFNAEFTGRENIYIRGILLGLTRKQIKSIEDKIIEFSEIDSSYIDQQLKRFSSGMIAKLGFAINLLCHPEILIIDEALAVGDVAFKNKCKNAIKEITLNNNEITLLFVSHDESMVKEFCQRGVVIHNNKILYDGQIDDAFKKYNKEVVNEINKK